CLTGCVSKEEKESANYKFGWYFSNVTIKPGETDTDMVISLELIEGNNIKDSISATLITDKTEYVSTEFYSTYSTLDIGGFIGVVSHEDAINFSFDNVNTTDYDSLAVTIIDEYQNEEITLTYYPDVA
ncbi:MAG: hypothetical protein LBM87_06260, partial [Ruminococcus sp.]|nr:hypothetical protein [Ruminococcus sp.]